MVYYFIPNGVLCSAYHLLNGKVDGLHTKHFENGSYSVTTYKDGKMHGKSYFVNSKGIITKMQTFKDNVLI